MRILNAKPIVEEINEANSMKISKSRMVDKFPCWYVDLETGDTLDEYHWRVGYVSDEKEHECTVNIVDIGDINDREFVKRVFGPDFSTKLLELYKQGGETAVKSWVSQGV